AIMAAIFLIVAGIAIYTLIRFGRRPTNPQAEPAQVYGSTQIELAWTVVPLLIVVVLFLVTARYIYGIERRPQPPDALELTVVGQSRGDGLGCSPVIQRTTWLEEVVGRGSNGRSSPTTSTATSRASSRPCARRCSRAATTTCTSPTSLRGRHLAREPCPVA